MSHDVAIDTATIRNLPQAASTADDLWRFCQDCPTFRFILDHFGRGFSFMQMIDAGVDLCQVRVHAAGKYLIGSQTELRCARGE